MFLVSNEMVKLLYSLQFAEMDANSEEARVFYNVLYSNDIETSTSPLFEHEDPEPVWQTPVPHGRTASETESLLRGTSNRPLSPTREEEDETDNTTQTPQMENDVIEEEEGGNTE